MRRDKSHAAFAGVGAVVGALLTAAIYLLAIGSTYGRLNEKVNGLGDEVSAFQNQIAEKLALKNTDVTKSINRLIAAGRVHQQHEGQIVLRDQGGTDGPKDEITADHPSLSPGK